MRAADGATLHASCVLVGEAGVLIEGASGAGKSALAREIVAMAQAGGRFARIVSDDRTRIVARHGRAIARPVDAIAGLLEIRGLGIVRTPHEPSAIVRLLISLSSETPGRLPDRDAAAFALCGIMVPRVFLKTGAASAALALAWLDRETGALVTL